MVTVIPVGAADLLAFRISGRLTGEEYRDVLLPPIRETIARGEPIKVLAVIEDFRGLEPGGLFEELKAAGKLGSAQRSLGSYFAVVTDTEWVGRSVALFGWLVPGEVRVFPAGQVDDAEAWLVGVG